VQEATLNVEVTFEVDVLRCDCGNSKSHAPYIDGSRLNSLRKLRARVLRRPLINQPCPTPRVERVIVTDIIRAADLTAIAGGLHFGDTSS